MKFGPSEYIMTLTGTGGTITYNGKEQNETFAVSAGDPIIIEAIMEEYYSGAIITAEILLNGKIVASESGAYAVSAKYVYTPSANATIARTTEGSWGGTQRISIVEE